MDRIASSERVSGQLLIRSANPPTATLETVTVLCAPGDDRGDDYLGVVDHPGSAVNAFAAFQLRPQSLLVFRIFGIRSLGYQREGLPRRSSLIQGRERACILPNVYGLG